MEKFQVGEEAIIVEHGKVIDMITGNGYAGCMCTTQDRNRYDKESNTIICSEYGTCLKSIYKKMDEDQKLQLIETIYGNDIPYTL